MTRPGDACGGADKPQGAADTDEAETRARKEAERRKRRARVFGEVLPEGTGDEKGTGWGDRDRSSEEWLRGQVPPHHG